MTHALRNPEISILPARLDDLPAIMVLERAGFPAAEQWSERSWRGELLAEHRTILIARAQHPAGVSRRRGIGADLVRAGLEMARQVGVRAVILDVAYHNEAAIALYQQLGFEQLSARKDYYGPGQHALILKLYDLQAWRDRLASMTEDV